MSVHFFKIIEIVAVLGSLSSIAYYVLCIWSAAGFLREKNVAGEGARSRLDLPPVSILKPLKGADSETYESLRSHCLQDYPEYEIVFGVSDRSDPAVDLVNQLCAEFPERAVRLIFCDKKLGNNVKVSNLAQMVLQARYEYLVVNDGDIRVAPDYLRSVVVPLADEEIGMVTCLYRGMAAATLGSRLESLGIGTDFAAGVLTARYLENGIRFGLGSTLAFRRDDLAAIGSFEAIADYLADDYELGVRIAALGRKVRLSEVVVETYLQPYSLGSFFTHQLRWARAIRDSRPGGYFGLLFTFGLPWALLALIAAWGRSWALVLLGVTAALRCAMGWFVGGKVLEDRQVLRWLWLLPLRDLLALVVWAASFIGHTVTWSGDSFRLEEGRLMRVER